LTPPLELQRSFDATVQKYADLCRSLRYEAEFLRKTRDLLLPRLLSGQLSVEEVA
jgi:type I restriction enzyme S subunit